MIEGNLNVSVTTLSLSLSPSLFLFILTNLVNVVQTRYNLTLSFKNDIKFMFNGILMMRTNEFTSPLIESVIEYFY